MSCLMARSCNRGNNGMVRLLVVEDEVRMAKPGRRGLREEGHAVDLADGERTGSGHFRGGT